MKGWLKATRADATRGAAGLPAIGAPPADSLATADTPPIAILARAIIARIALRTGNSLLKQGVDRGILGQAPAKLKTAAKALGKAAGNAAAKAPAQAPDAKIAKQAKPKRSIGTKLVSAVATRIATRVATSSVPGAIVIGGALLAKSLYDRKRAKKP